MIVVQKLAEELIRTEPYVTLIVTVSLYVVVNVIPTGLVLASLAINLGWRVVPRVLNSLLQECHPPAIAVRKFYLINTYINHA